MSDRPRLRIVMLAPRNGGLVARSRIDPEAIFISPNSGRIARDGVEIACPSREGRILLFLLASRGPVSAADIFNFLWGEDPDGGPDNVTNSVSNVVRGVAKLAAALQIKLTRYSREAVDFYQAIPDVIVTGGDGCE